MDTESFIWTIKNEDVYKDSHSYLEAKFDTSDYSDGRINLYKVKRVNKKV